MLYLGHFSFAYESRLGSKRLEPWHGNFTSAAGARTVHEALRKFETLIRKLAAEHEVFDDVGEIYMESCVEVKAMPRTGFIGQVELQQGPAGLGMSATLPGTSKRSAVSYQIEPESEDEEGIYEPRPFITLTRRARGRKRKRAR
jgi:hypothetical protein